MDTTAKRDLLVEIGARIRSARLNRGLTVEALAAASGDRFSRSAIGSYERAERVISALALMELADILGVPVSDLLPSDDMGTSAWVLVRLDGHPAAVEWAARAIPGYLAPFGVAAAVEPANPVPEP